MTPTRYPPYPDTRDSGVEWLGEIPSHWDSAKIIRYAQLRTGGTPNRENIDFWENGTINWMSSGEVNKKRVYEIDHKITPAGFANSNASILPVHSVMIALNGQGKTKGTVATLEVETTCNQSLAAFICDASRLHYNYLFYFLESKYYELRGLVGDSLRDGLSLGLLKTLYTPLPPGLEQQAIADFLDRETTRLDALIDAKRRLIDLLKEQRAALISHVVTKGPDPNAPMKDSGIEWLGEIPAHWEAVKLKYLARIGNGSTPLKSNQAYWQNGTFPWLTSTMVNQDIIGEPIEFVTDLALKECHLPIVSPGSILMAITGQGKTRGMCGLLDYEATINQHLVYISPNTDSAIPEYLQLYLTSVYDMLRLISEGAGSTRGALTIEQVSNFHVFVPPVQEQKLIVQEIGEYIRLIDNLSTKTKYSIQQLEEYRTALIAAAVTGKIDVRGEL